MRSSYREAAYRTASASGATHIGLLLLVYDALASDLSKAAEALTRGDIAWRCNLSNHALLLLGHLEQWCDVLDDGSLANSLRQFYGHLRQQLLTYQATGTPDDFRALAGLVLETRAVWQLKEQRSSDEGRARNGTIGGHEGAFEVEVEVSTSGWSA